MIMVVVVMVVMMTMMKVITSTFDASSGVWLWFDANGGMLLTTMMMMMMNDDLTSMLNACSGLWLWFDGMVLVNSEDGHDNGDADTIMMMTMITHSNGCL